MNYFKNISILQSLVLTKYDKSADGKDRNNDFVNIIKSALTDLKDDIKKMSEDEKRNEQPQCGRHC